MVSVSDGGPVDPTGHPRRYQVLVVCCLGLFLVVSALTSLNVALPAMQEDLNASNRDLQWIIDSYAIVFGGLLLTAGAVGDRIGRKPVLLAGFAVFALGGALGALAGDVNGVILARAISGLGAAMMLPATLSVLTEVFIEEEQARAIALWAGIAGAGAAIGPALGGWLLEISWWGSVFAMNAVIAGAAAVATAIVVPRLPGSRGGRIDIPGAVLSTAAIGLLLYALIEAPGGWNEPVVIGTALAGAAAVWLFLRHEASTADPMLPLEVFAKPRLRVGAITLMLSAIGFAGVVFVASLHLQIGWGEGPLVTGLLILPIGLSELVSSNRSVALIRRFDTGSVIATGLVIMAVGYVMMALTPTGDRLLFVIAGLIAGVGNGMVIAPSVERVVGGAEPRLAGVTAGVNETSVELGASLGVALLGGIQRLVFDGRLPDGVPSESVNEALAVADTEVVLEAFRLSSKAALIGAAIAVLSVIPWAGRRLESERDMRVKSVDA